MKKSILCKQIKNMSRYRDISCLSLDVMCCIFGDYISLSFTVDILLSVYLMIVLLFYLFSICLMKGIKESGHCILVFFVVTHIIGNSTLLSLIVQKILSCEFLAYIVSLVLLHALLLGWSIALIKVDNLESLTQKQIDGRMNLLNTGCILV